MKLPQWMRRDASQSVSARLNALSVEISDLRRAVEDLRRYVSAIDAGESLRHQQVIGFLDEIKRRTAHPRTKPKRKSHR